jgi:hypothetical protein
MFASWRPWDAAKRACRDTGGHLVRIDDDNEQHFLSSYVRPKRWVCKSLPASFGNKNICIVLSTVIYRESEYSVNQCHQLVLVLKN